MKTSPFLAAALALPTVLALPGPVLANPYLGRCHMGECLHYDQVSRSVIGTGSAAVPGALVLVALRSAVSDRADPDPATLDWEALAPVQVFCAMDRPAYRLADGAYQGLDLVTPAGATTLVATIYLHACHPGAEISDDPFAAARALGYAATPIMVHANLDALTRR